MICHIKEFVILSLTTMPRVKRFERHVSYGRF